jgi:hypothetical protein
MTVGAPSFDYVAGIFRSFEQGAPGEACPSAGLWFHYTQAGGGGNQACTSGGNATVNSCFIQDTVNGIDAGLCTRFSHAASGSTAAFTYLRCW